MITIIHTDSGNYNIFGTVCHPLRDGDDFILQGNLTREQLVELHQEISKTFLIEGARQKV